MARPSRNSCTAYALRNYSQKDVLNVQVTEVSVHAVLDCSSVMRWMDMYLRQAIELHVLLLLLLLLLFQGSCKVSTTSDAARLQKMKLEKEEKELLEKRSEVRNRQQVSDTA